MKILKQIKHQLLLLSLSLFLCFDLTGCGMVVGDLSEFETEETEDITEDLTVIGFSQLGSESGWRTANTVSIQKALTKENGYFLQFNNARQKQENQIKALRSYISQRVDYIVFSPVIEDGWDTVLQEAKDAGIPVILVDRTVSVKDDSLYITWVGSNSRKEGESAGEWLEKYLTKHPLNKPEGEKINIVVLQGTTGSSAQLGRTMGFDSVADTHPEWNILAQESGDFTTAKGKEVMQKMLRRYENIDVVVSQNDDMTFGAIEAIKEAGMRTGVGGDITLISFDAIHEALELVQSGTINVDIECNPNQGELLNEVLQKLLHGETVEKAYEIDEQIFTIDNVDDYIDDRTY